MTLPRYSARHRIAALLLILTALCPVMANQDGIWETTASAIENGDEDRINGEGALPNSAAIVSQDLRLQRPKSTMLAQHDDPLPPFAISWLARVNFSVGLPVGRSAISPDGRLLASASESIKRLDFWDAKTGRKVGHVSCKNHPEAIAFSPDSKQVAILAHGIISIADVKSGALIRELDLRDRPWRTFRHREYLALLPGGKQILLADMRTEEASLIDAHNGREIRKFVSLTTGIAAASLTSNGKLMAMAEESGAVRLFDIATGKERLKLEKPRAFWSAVAFSGDNRILAASCENAVCLWDTDSGKMTLKLVSKARLGEIRALDVSPDGKDLLAQEDAGISIWEIATGKETLRINVALPSGRARFMHDGRTIIQEALNGFSFFDVATGKPCPVPDDSLGGPVQAVSYSSEGKYLAISAHAVQVWDTQRRQVIWRSPTRDVKLRSLTFSSNSKLLAAGSANDIVIWDLDTGVVRQVLRGPSELLAAMSFTPDATKLAVGYSDGRVLLFDLSTGQQLQEFDVKKVSHSQMIGTVAFSADLSVMAIMLGQLSGEGETRTFIDLWDVEYRKRRKSISILARAQRLTDMSLSPDNRTIVFNGDLGKLTYCETASGQVIREETLKRWGGVMTFSPDLRLLALTGDFENDETQQIQILDMRRGGKPVTLGGGDLVISLCFSPDGRTMASGSLDRTALLWDLNELEGSKHRVSALSRQQHESCWNELAQDAQLAFGAMERLLNDPGAVDFLQQKLLIERAVIDSATVAKLIADLDRKEFRVRTQAKERLSAFGGVIEGELRKALASKPSPEASRSLEEILQSVGGPGLRFVRSVQLLEWINTPSARQLLEKLGSSQGDSTLAQEAKTALARLQNRISTRNSMPPK